MSFFLQPQRPFEFTSSVFDYIKMRLLWIKPISSIIYASPKLRLMFTSREVNERIIETPFILGNLPKSGNILDVGACESSISLMLASMGYKVWANDTRKYPFSHPNLNIDNESILQLEKPSFFDCVICLSTLEHIGHGVYGNKKDKGTDQKVVDKILSLLKKDGKLLLTTPIDKRYREIPLSRIYTTSMLKILLKDFTKVEIKIGYKDRNEVWRLADRLPQKFKSFGDKECAVALVTATK